MRNRVVAIAFAAITFAMTASPAAAAQLPVVYNGILGYAHASPTLWGFPFFYWYQFAWTIFMAPLTWLVYLRSK